MEVPVPPNLTSLVTSVMQYSETAPNVEKKTPKISVNLTDDDLQGLHMGIGEGLLGVPNSALFHNSCLSDVSFIQNKGANAIPDNLLDATHNYTGQRRNEDHSIAIIVDELTNAEADQQQRGEILLPTKPGHQSQVSESDGGTTAKSYCPSVSMPTRFKAAAQKMAGAARVNLEVDFDKTQFETKKMGSFIRNDFAESDDEIDKSIDTTDEGMSILGSENMQQSRQSAMRTCRVHAVPEIQERSPPSNVKARQLSQENKRLFTFSKQR